VQENSLVWRYSYDANGNLIKLVFGKNEHNFAYNEADQLVSYSNNQAARVTYDSHGRMVQTHKQFQMRYSANGLLLEATRISGAGPKRQILYYYDHLGRLIGRHDDEGRTTQFFYALPGRPYKVSHIYSAWEDTLISLVYNTRDQVVFARLGQREYYIISDLTGAPFLFFASPSGDLVKEVNRSPYGQITYDSDPSVSLPLGLWGGIEDVEAGLLHVQGPGGSRPYDPLAGLYLTPDWETVPAAAYTPELLHVYRANGNDPVNTLTTRFLTGTGIT
jgi:YD repeat-containing protein